MATRRAFLRVAGTSAVVLAAGAVGLTQCDPMPEAAVAVMFSLHLTFNLMTLGGIAAAMAPDDDWRAHAADTIARSRRVWGTNSPGVSIRMICA